MQFQVVSYQRRPSLLIRRKKHATELPWQSQISTWNCGGELCVLHFAVLRYTLCRSSRYLPGHMPNPSVAWLALNLQISSWEAALAPRGRTRIRLFAVAWLALSMQISGWNWEGFLRHLACVEFVNVNLELRRAVCVVPHYTPRNIACNPSLGQFAVARLALNSCKFQRY